MVFNRKLIKTLAEAQSAWDELFKRELPDVKAKKDEKNPLIKPDNKPATAYNPKQKAALTIQKNWRKFRDKHKLDSTHPSTEFVYFLNNKSLLKSLDKGNIDQVQKLLNKGVWNEKLFINKNFPYWVITLYADKKLTSLQAYSCLCIYQARQQFRDLRGIAVLDEKGNFTAEAKKYFIPSLNHTTLFTPIKDETLESLRLLVLTLPLSERYFFMANLSVMPKPTELSKQLSITGTFLSIGDYTRSDFIYLTTGLKDAVGIARFGVEQHVRSIPRLGDQSNDDIEAGVRKDLRSSTVRIDSKIAFKKIHGFEDTSPIILKMHDDYHADVYSSIPKSSRRGIERLIDITRERFLKTKWSREVYEWMDSENRYLMVNWDELGNEHNTTGVFCNLLSESKAYGNERGGFLIDFKNNYDGELTILGVNFILDLLENKDKWIRIGIYPEKLIAPFKHFYDDIKKNYKQINNPDFNKTIFNCKLYLALKNLNKQELFACFIEFFERNALPTITYQKQPKSNRILFLIGKDVIHSDKDLINAIKNFITLKENAKYTETMFDSDLNALEFTNYVKYRNANITHEQAVYLAKPTFGNWFALDKAQNACIALTVVGFLGQCFYYNCVGKQKNLNPTLFSNVDRKKDNTDDKHTIYMPNRKK